MKTREMKALLSKKFDVQVNELNADKLFKKYESIGFIYPAKKKLLKPHFQKIKENWNKMLSSTNPLNWVLSHSQSIDNQDFASISFWQQSNHGLFAQHLVSTGQASFSLKVMLAAQYAAEVFFEADEIKSSQNWFRPNNRYAYRVFASMFKELGNQKAALREFQYLHLPLNQIETTIQNEFIIEPVKGIHPAMIEFVKKEYGQVFVAAEELDQEDIELSKINQKYHQNGLDRSRAIYVIKDQNSEVILATVIANRAPIGINFSFLENRAYYIIKQGLSTNQRTKVLGQINQVLKSYYKDFELGAIPIVTDKLTSECLQTQGANFQRAYMQSIWLRSGFLQWYDHIYTFMQQLEARAMAKEMMKKALAKERTLSAIAV